MSPDELIRPIASHPRAPGFELSPASRQNRRSIRAGRSTGNFVLVHFSVADPTGVRSSGGAYLHTFDPMEGLLPPEAYGSSGSYMTTGAGVEMRVAEPIARNLQLRLVYEDILHDYMLAFLWHRGRPQPALEYEGAAIRHRQVLERRLLGARRTITQLRHAVRVLQFHALPADDSSDPPADGTPSADFRRASRMLAEFTDAETAAVADLLESGRVSVGELDKRLGHTGLARLASAAVASGVAVIEGDELRLTTHGRRLWELLRDDADSPS